VFDEENSKIINIKPFKNQSFLKPMSSF